MQLKHHIGFVLLLSSSASAQVNIGGTVSDSLTGPLAGDTIYHVGVNGLQIPDGHNLTIGSGAILKFTSGGIIAIGTLQVQGTAANPVLFTSDEDDTAGGDTYQDGPTMGAPSQWGSIALNQTSGSSVIDFLEVRFANGNGSAAISCATPGSELRNCTVRSAGFDGFGLGTGNSSVLMQNCTALNNGGMAFNNVHWDQLVGVSGCQASGNTEGDILQVIGTPSADMTVGPQQLLDSTLAVAGSMLIPVGVTLTLEAGTVVKLRPQFSSSVDVSGTLLAQGTELAPVVFTSIDDDAFGGDALNDGPSPSPGFWLGMRLNDSSDDSVLEHVHLRYGGNAQSGLLSILNSAAVLSDVTVQHASNDGVDLNNTGGGSLGRPTLTGVHVQDCGGRAYMDIPVTALPGFTENTASNCAGGNGMRILGNVAEDISIGPQNAVGGVFVVGSNVTIEQGGRLAVEAGTIFKFEPGFQKRFIVGGELDVQGTPQEPVTMTSLADDSVGGDTNLDGSASQPLAGDLGGILVHLTSTGSRIQNLLVRYAGLSFGRALQFLSADVELDFVRVELGGGTAFEFANLGLDARRCVAYANGGRGIVVNSGAADLLEATVVDNGDDGIVVAPGFQGQVLSSISWGNAGENFLGLDAGQLRYSNGSSLLAGADGNLDQDPLFLDSSAGDLGLQSGSPSIDAGDPGADVDPDCTRLDQGAYFFDQGAPSLYCTSQLNSAGCAPTVAFDGFATLSTGAPFVISVDGVTPQSNGILFYGLDGAQALPFLDGTLCVQANDFFYRLPTQGSGQAGSDPACSGTFSYDFNAHLQAGADPRLGPGIQVYAQFWYRDLGSPSTTATTNAVTFLICP